MANAAADEDSGSLPESASDCESGREARGVRYVAHNFPNNDEDAQSTIRSLLEPGVIVRHCQLSTSGLSQFSFADSIAISITSPKYHCSERLQVVILS